MKYIKYSINIIYILLIRIYECAILIIKNLIRKKLFIVNRDAKIWKINHIEVFMCVYVLKKSIIEIYW